MIDPSQAKAWYDEKIQEFRSIIENTPEKIARQYDAHIVTSYSRDIIRDDVTYKLTVVVRDHPIQNICTTNKDKTMYHYVLFALASRVVWQWMNFASEMRDGNVTAYDPDDELFGDKWSLPDYSGYATVTAWGNVIDKSGRTTGLTITDKSNLSDIPERMTFSNGLYDSITEMSGGVDMNADGQFAGYSTRIEKSKPGTKSSAYGSGKRKADVKPKTKEELPIFETMDNIKVLPTESTFRVKIGKIATRNTGTEDTPVYLTSFYGYGLNGDGDLVIDGRDGIYVYSNKIRDYKRISEQTLSLGINIKSGETVLGEPIVIEAKKRVSANNKAFYVDINII